MVETRNHADALIYQTEKSIKDLGDKVDAETRQKIEAASASLKSAIDKDDVELIRSLSEELTQASHKLAEAMYQQASQSEQQADTGAETNRQTAGGGAGAADEDVVDADFEEVKDDEKK